jgi:hypothetical protein
MAIKIKLFVATSGPAPHPSIEIPVGPEFKILGGGAFDHWTGDGNLLTAAYPKDVHTWRAAGKDHEISDPASITGFVLAINDPHNEWEVIIKSETSNPAPHPQAVATLPEGFTLTGGGAFVDWRGAGNLLTASFPTSDTSWEARSKDHDVPDPSKITAYAIGLRHRTGKIKLAHSIVKFSGPVVPHPSARVCLSPEFILTGGGALDDWSGNGNILTASFPQGRCWNAAGKDHNVPSPASITAYAVGIRAV